MWRVGVCCEVEGRDMAKRIQVKMQYDLRGKEPEHCRIRS